MLTLKISPILKALCLSVAIIVTIFFAIVLFPPNMTPERPQSEERAFGVVSTNPQHGQVLASVPAEVTITVDRPLLEPSAITIIRNQNIIGGAGGIFSADKFILHSTIMPNHGLLESVYGLYTVRYLLCYEHRASCENGLFQFKVRK